MEIPYTVRPRPDTGLSNPKLGIWLFLASEVMLFGGLFAGYIFMRLGAEPWMWPHGWLNVPVGTFNTFILIASSVTVILSWESLKMRNFKAYKSWLAATWICGLAFLAVKLSYEWPDKFHHFGAYIRPEALHKYESHLGNEDVVKDGAPEKDAKGNEKLGRRSRGLAERRFISGHLDTHADPYAMKSANIPFVSATQLDAVIALGSAEPDAAKKAKLQGKRKALLDNLAVRPADVDVLLTEPLDPKKKEEILHRMNTIHVHELDMENMYPYDPANDKARFLPAGREVAHDFSLDKKDLIHGHGAWVPKLNTYLACYFMITGLHGAHVLGGCIVFIYFWLNIKGGSKLYQTNPQQLSNRIEIAGLFWHLVDLIWIFVFPIFYLL
jgi:heme/copper-type cytochrome/quinol oxidase subunit 3